MKMANEIQEQPMTSRIESSRRLLYAFLLIYILRVFAFLQAEIAD